MLVMKIGLAAGGSRRIAKRQIQAGNRE